jgi:signal transduction histidine kinase
MRSDKANILIVDDQPSNLLALEAILEGLGQNLVRATSGEEALRRLLEQDFAVLLMDVKMPGMDGIETAALIRARDRSRHTPIIFLTAIERSEVEMFKGYQLGAVDYLFKPPQPEILRSKVAVFVELHRKTEQVRRQAEQLRDNERREMERRLAAEKQRWEMERLREEAERERQAAEALKEADRRKDEFLAMLAHELRNPLAPILNALHLIREHRDDREALDMARDIVERQVKHMARLIDDLLDVSRINSGKIKLQRERVELTDVIQRAVETVAPLLRSRRHELSVTLPPRPVWLDADPTRLEQVFSNLLNNSAKYTPEAGHIWLTAEVSGQRSEVRSPRSEVRGQETENGSSLTADFCPLTPEQEVVVSIRDDGIGIPEDMLERIFELFAQVDRSLSSASQWGLGIGLALVRTLVDMHGGSVKASSAGANKGSEFVVRLPLLAGSREPIRPAEEAPAVPAARQARILVVDDSRDAAQSLALLLRIKGHDVRTAHDGPEALDVARQQQPDVVFLDIGLPHLNGFEVASRLRREPGTRDAYLIAMTGYGQDEDRRRSREAGFNCHLVKPVDPEDLQQLLEHREPVLAPGPPASPEA